MQLLLNRAYTLLNGPFVAALLLKNHHAGLLSALHHRWIDRGLLVVFAGLLAGTSWVCASNVVHPRPWDYPCFYTVARAAVSGQAFYEPEVLKATFQAANTDGSVPDLWFSELTYMYLPPSALLLAPLGLLGYRPSLAVHYLIQSAFLVASALLLHRYAPVRRGWRGAIEIMILLLAFRPVVAAFDVAQMVFGALFFTVLAIIALPTQPILAGFALAFGSLYKHLLAIVALLAIQLRRLSTTVAFTVGVVILLTAGLVIFGATSFRDFSTYGPSSRAAGEYVEVTNQSLLAVFYRLSGQTPDSLGILRTVLFPPFVLAGAILAIATGLLCRFGRESNLATYLRAALLVSVALLLYPNTLYNTVPLILPGLVIAFSFRDQLPVPGWVVVAFVAVEYAAASIPDGGGFAAVLLSWCGTATLLLAVQLRPQP